VTSGRDRSRGSGDALTMEGVTRTFGPDVIACDRIDLTVRNHEFVTLLGPSGSGKTTTLRLVAGFLAPDQGRILLGGEDVTKMPSHKRDVGMVFQNYALFPHLTVEQNLAFPLQERRVSSTEIRRRVGQSLERVRLLGMEKRYPRQLSGGQQQRVAFARAVIYEPRLLLMDEPLGALDRRLREDLQLELKHLHAELDVTVLYVTHDQEEALVLSDRIAVFNRGRIEQIGVGEVLYRRPRSRFVGSFIGDSNIFVGAATPNGAVTTIATPVGPLRGLPHPDAAVGSGQRGVLIVRPENIRVVSTDPSPTASTDRVPAVVKQSIYLGAAIKYELNCRGTTLYARMNPRPELLQLLPGTAVTAEWDVADAVVVPD
jgi:putative spermidine/putrescine transport system ATP-binding protein